MAVRVKVRAAIWIDGKLAVHRSRRLGRQRTTLPGGWVGRRESVTDALVREVKEELGIDVDVGDLLCAGEVVNSATRQDLELVFAATPRAPIDGGRLTLVDPCGPAAQYVLPPILAQLAEQHDAAASGAPTQRWLGNLYVAGLKHS
ncbi:MAG TPA: NUDIX domain-containing protein [Solirubrobacteraceae bacterium]|nr:NUDIX domain-containing protein [Solirubrobacteraceae bacterium]